MDHAPAVAANMDISKQFPVGSAITLPDLDRNPYPVYKRLRDEEPVTWCAATGMYLVTRYDDVRDILRDTDSFIAGTEHSLIMDTFGAHMLTTEGELHDTYKQPLLPLFRPLAVKEQLETAIATHVSDLLASFRHQGEIEMRSAFASRLPVLAMLSLFGLPACHESLLRGWYNAFEKALANFTWEQQVREEAHRQVAEFHHYLQNQIENKRAEPDDALLSQMIANRESRPLSDEEVRRNASIIFFGGISTVEALILNSLYVLTDDDSLMERLRSNPEQLPSLLDEVVRWSGPVQSATRHVTRTTELHGVEFKAGDTVNCMLASANHDPAVFEEPSVFNMDRPNLRQQIGFAIGSHHCLGSHLAKLEASLALEGLLKTLPRLRRSTGTEPAMSGYEFRQPNELLLSWDLTQQAC